MARIYFSRGVQGAIARQIQGALLARGVFAGSRDKFVDGDFGGHTEVALGAFQTAQGLAATGSVDAATWDALLHEPLPSVFQRCLGLTANFEGHGFGLAKGNFDGAGLTWGIIGFTLSNGEVQKITQAAEALQPGTWERGFQALAEPWRRVCEMPLAAAVAWADGISSGPRKEGLPAEWLAAFARLGDDPVIQQVQRDRSLHKYFEPAVQSARDLGLTTELGLALAFDVHVQNGGFKPSARPAVERLGAAATQRDRRMALANDVALSAAPRWQADVRTRKEALAEGQGAIHGAPYVVKAWGLDDSPIDGQRLA